MIRIAREKGLLTSDSCRSGISPTTGTARRTITPTGRRRNGDESGSPSCARTRGLRREGSKLPRTLVTSPQGARSRSVGLASSLWSRRSRSSAGGTRGSDERVIPLLLGARRSRSAITLLSGGEPAAIVILDALARLLPGVLGTRSRRKPIPFRSRSWTLPCTLAPRTFERQACS